LTAPNGLQYITGMRRGYSSPGAGIRHVAEKANSYNLFPGLLTSPNGLQYITGMRRGYSSPGAGIRYVAEKENSYNFDLGGEEHENL
jgi:hypothetical protein